MGTQTYEVELDRTADRLHVRSRVRDFVIELGAHRGDAAGGINAVETLLSAVGTCFTTSFVMVAELSGVAIGRLKVQVSAVRQDRPPLLVSIRYTAFIEADAGDGKVDRLVALAERNSTVIGTLRGALPLTGGWRRYEETGD